MRFFAALRVTGVAMVVHWSPPGKETVAVGGSTGSPPAGLGVATGRLWLPFGSLGALGHWIPACAGMTVGWG